MGLGLRMVERSPDVENIEQFMTNLNQAAEKLNEIRQKKQEFSGQELNELITVLNRFNTAFDPNFWEEKKLVPEEMSADIEKALAVLQLFQSNQPEKNKAAQKNVDQAITSLFSTLSKEISAFDKNLRNLKKYKIGLKVEETYQSKQS
jgi:uncharacterized protein HemX